MAKNREPEKPVESQSDSGDEEESGEELEEASSEESDSEPELEKQKKKVTTPAPPQKQIKVSNKATPIKQTQSSSSSSSEEESGSESESDSDRPEVASPQPSGPKKPRSGVQATTTSTLAKRPAEDKESEGRDAKKAKKKPDSPPVKDDPKKSSLFQRLWSEDDEIAILKGMIEYSSKKKSDPVADVSAFLDFIKEDLHVDVSRTQLQDKIRRLKKKYENNKSKEKDGKSRTFGKSHEQKAYELSKLVWGKDNGGGENGVGSPKANGNGSAAKRALLIKKAAAAAGAGEENEEVKESGGVVVSCKNEGLSSIGGSSVEERIMRAGEELFGGEDEWRKLKVEEIELYVKQVEVKLAQSRLVLGALKSANC